jgi:hypothetical protein
MNSYFMFSPNKPISNDPLSGSRTPSYKPGFPILQIKSPSLIAPKERAHGMLSVKTERPVVESVSG